jgi:hypothetical protein
LTAKLETFTVAYCAEEAAMLVPVEFPVELLIVKLPAEKFVLVNDVIPATAISKY